MERDGPKIMEMCFVAFIIILSVASLPIVRTAVVRGGLRRSHENISTPTPAHLSTRQGHVSMSSDSSRLHSSLPLGWEKMCTTSERFVDWDFSTLAKTEVDNMVQISCHLNSDNISFIDFRQWSAQVDNKLALKVVCHSSEGSFHLPWPIKAKNLVFLRVQECKLEGYYSEYFSKEIEKIPDELRVFELNGTTSMISPIELEHTIMNMSETGISSDILCGPLTLEKQVYSNCGFDLDLDYDYNYDDYTDIVNDTSLMDNTGSPEGIIDWDVTSDIWRNAFLRMEGKCDYRSLRYFTENHMKSMKEIGSYMDVLTEHSLFPNLLLMNLSHNGFLRIPEELQKWRYDIPKLVYLDLSYNDIDRIDIQDNGFPDDGLGRINLQFNNITTIRSEDIRAIKRLESAIVDISNNPINCGCGDIKELYEFQAEGNLGNYEYIRDLVCHSPVSLKGRKIRNLTQKEIICPTGEAKKVHMVLIVSLCAVVVILGIIIIILLRYRREVVILVYTRLHIILPCQPVDTYDSKNYDAFISYSSKDDDWVLRTLVQRLENNEKGEKFKLCVHHRDFEIGAAIADNVVQSVEDSRHTVMVLSRNYVDSEWCIYEFRTALHQSLIERQKHLIVVILEDVPKSELDADLRKCLETFTYIQVGDKLFWDKIRYSLGHRHKQKSSSTSSQGCTDPSKTSESSSREEAVPPSSENIHTNMPSVV